jgi:two-component system NtrC family sensor kinase
MRELRIQFVSALLVILTVAALISAGINFQQQNKFRLPEDGVTWGERADGLEALHVVSGSPADKAGIRVGDVLLRINDAPVQKATDITRILVGLGAWNKAEYSVHRRGVDIKTALIIGERLPDRTLYYQYVVGLAFLAIGLFVYFRRGNAQKATHFYILCLASFILSTFHYTGKLNDFDKVMYWGNVAAGLFAPTIFLHFCLIFPEARSWLRGKGRSLVIYLPAAFLLMVFAGVSSGTLRVSMPAVELRWLLDRIWLVFLAVAYLAGGLVLGLRARRAEDPILRQQLKWLRNGAFFGVGPFVIFYVLPYALGAVPGPYMNVAVVSLVIVPVTWAYAVLRYRLMDVDVIFQQGYAYTLATLCIIGLFYALILSLGKFENPSPAAIIFLILIAAFAFQPIRNWIQDQLDKYYFYKDRYDYRRTLIEFARELSTETDLDAMLSSVAERLIHTLSVPRVTFFLSDEASGRFHLKAGFGVTGRDEDLGRLDPIDLSFLSSDPAKPYMFFERPRHPLDIVSREWPQSVRKTIADLDLTYYITCTARGKTIAYLGVSRTDKGDFLSSDDVELLVTLSGYVGIAIENTRLYSSLQRKVEENERLREFNENIVESINVGILAADLEDRVESWNSQIEQLTGIPREVALGKPLSVLFPSELAAKFDDVRDETGIHHIYKFTLRPDTMVLMVGNSSGDNGHSRGNGWGVSNQQQTQPASSEITVNIAIAPLVSREEQRIGRLIIFDDVTDRAELERRLVQADKLSSIGLLAAGVAHEVNTPLAVISTYAQMLAKQVAGDEGKSVLLDKIAKQTFRASEIVNSLLSFSRTSTKDFVEVDLDRVIRETLTLLEHQLKKAGIAVDVELEESLPPVKGNFGKLQQVFLNLYLNARDAMERGGRLTVKAWSTERGVEVQVRDTGSGIPPEHLQRIYDPFFTTKAARKGTGLGLAVTYGIVKEHGGAIEVDSQPGQGAQFHLEFPLARKTVNV